MQLKVVTRRAPSEKELADLLFALNVAKHVKSNAIVYVKDGATVGIGAGQMSRVDAARIAARKAEDAAKEAELAQPLTKGSVVASDAFFPFPDGLLVAIEAGATAVIQPGGSIHDADVIAAADEADLAMVFTGVRHFRHLSGASLIAAACQGQRPLARSLPATSPSRLAATDSLDSVGARRRARGSAGGCARLPPAAA